MRCTGVTGKSGGGTSHPLLLPRSTVTVELQDATAGMRMRLGYKSIWPQAMLGFCAKKEDWAFGFLRDTGDVSTYMYFLHARHALSKLDMRMCCIASKVQTSAY